MMAGRDHDLEPLRERLVANRWPAYVYAIGDVHGCFAELQQLEHKIYDNAADVEGEKWIVGLGDYVDRGPNSASVLDHLLSRPPSGWKRLCLAGNHEIMFLEFLRNPQPGSQWLDFGGAETLSSYGISAHALARQSPNQRRDTLLSHIPDEHLAFLRGLPVALSLPGCIFVHAGIRPGVPLINQSEDDLLWIRKEFFDAIPQPDLLVVHGHTPAETAVVVPGRICIDTGAFATGILTAVRLSQGGEPRLIDTAPAAIPR